MRRLPRKKYYALLEVGIKDCACGWENGSVSAMLFIQEYDINSHIQIHIKACNPRWETKTGGFQKLTGQLACYGQ